MASTEGGAEILIAVVIRSILILAMPMLYLYLYVLAFDWLTAGNPLYSSAFINSKQAARQLVVQFGSLGNYYLHLIMTHGFSFMLGASICAPIIKSMFKKWQFSVVTSYALLGVVFLFNTRWPDLRIFDYPGDSLANFVVAMLLVLCPYIAFSVLRWLYH